MEVNRFTWMWLLIFGYRRRFKKCHFFFFIGKFKSNKIGGLGCASRKHATYDLPTDDYTYLGIQLSYNFTVNCGNIEPPVCSPSQQGVFNCEE